MNLIRVISIFMLSFLMFGCVSSGRRVDLDLEPAWVAVVFSAEAEPSKYIDDNYREWMIAAAFFIYKNEMVLNSTEELNDFIASSLKDGVKLKLPIVEKNERGEFIVPLRSGGRMAASITPHAIKIATDNAQLHDALFRTVLAKSPLPRAETRAPEAGVITALLNALTHGK